MTDEGSPVVLVVDDEPDMTRLYEAWLSGEYGVRVANDGHEALERIDERVDLVFLDRRMPDLLGREVLERIREAGYDCRVAMLTAVAPDVDIIRMGFDAYLTKPVDRDDVLDAAERLLSLDQYDDALEELYVLVEKRSSLERAVPGDDLSENPAYNELEDRIEELEDQLDDTMQAFDENSFRAMFREM
ncbi:response regulator [Salarchaeum japonicum]|uniref:response regulator n=1 Tax=Salarchaeum japonicum TaxID=555573 RepID=UPI003C7881D4